MADKVKGQSRRGFLKTMGAAGAGALLAAGGQAAIGAGPARAEVAQVPRRTFGKTGVEVSTLSLGGIIDFRVNQILLHQALKMGIDYWDTAESYNGGNSEEGIGRYLARYPQMRKSIFLVTKSTARDPKMMTISLNESLKRLKTDYIDLFFMHAIRHMDVFDRPEVKAWAQEMKAAGKIRLYGFSTHSNMEELLLGASRLNWVDGIMMTYNYRIMRTKRMKQAVQACHQAGIGLTAMKTQGGGPVLDSTAQEMELAGRFLRRGFSPEQAKLMAVWQDKRIAAICSQMPNTTVLMANAAASLERTTLSSRDAQDLGRLARATACNYCAGCADICEQAMEGRAPVADVMRSLMYARSHRDLELAKHTFAEALPQGAEPALSLDYAPAERACPQGLPIGRLVAEAAEILA